MHFFSGKIIKIIINTNKSHSFKRSNYFIFHVDIYFALMLFYGMLKIVNKCHQFLTIAVKNQIGGFFMKLKKAVIFFGVFILFYGSVFGMIFGNDSCTTFLTSNCDTGDLSGSLSMVKKYDGVSMSQLIVDAAGYYLNANSDFQMVLKKVELSEYEAVDSNLLSELLESTLFNLENARATYEVLLEEANSYDYNPDVVAKLKEFDYDSYLQEHGLVPSIFGEVEEYLSEGDVRGFYKQVIKRCGKILEALYSTREVIASGKLPEVSKLWRINQMYLETELFGQYVAEVFMNL